MTTASLLAASPYDTTSTSAGIGGAVVLVLVLVYAAVMALVIWAYVRVARKAGYSPWWALGAFVPLLNIVVFLVFAFGEWPVERELADLRSRVAYLEGRGGQGQLGGGQYGGGQYGGGQLGGGQFGGGQFGGGQFGGGAQRTPQPSAWPSGPAGSLG